MRVAVKSRDAILDKDTILKGTIKNGGRIEVYGYIEGQVNAESLCVHEGGRVFGSTRVDNAEVHGLLQGEAIVRQLISIGSTGQVIGNVRYGAIALESGGELSAELRNIPPHLAGDLEIVVARGGHVVITSMDLTAIDPDDAAHSLTFTVSDVAGGWVAMAEAVERAVGSFTEADIQSSRVLFVHDGSAAREGSFNVVVADQSGATSGTPQTVRVAVR